MSSYPLRLIPAACVAVVVLLGTHALTSASCIGIVLRTPRVEGRTVRAEAARAQYLRATELGPDVSAAWFGLSMSERRIGNAASADSAMQRVRQLAAGHRCCTPGTTPGASHERVVHGRSP